MTKKSELAKVLTVNDEGEVVSRFPFVDREQLERTISYQEYLSWCEELGRKPTQDEWLELYWQRNDEGPAA